MERSPAVLNLSNCLNKILDHFESEYPREGCGVLAVKKGKLEWYPCTNVANDSDDFIIKSSEYLKIRRTSDIVAIVHSHPDTTSEPSSCDIANCNAVGLPYYIFSYPGMELTVVEPTINTAALLGRTYKFGISDCFEAARDYYTQEGIELPRRALYEDDWWLKGLDYFTEEHINTWGFNKVVEPKKNDLLIFAVGSKIGNHCGVYIGNDVFFHHATQRLSCKENLYPFWVKHLLGTYRYEA